MPNTDNTLCCQTPRYCALELMDCVNGLYQSRFIDNEEKEMLTDMISEGMDDGDFADLSIYVTEQCRHVRSGNPFYHRMRTILSEEEIQ